MVAASPELTDGVIVLRPMTVADAEMHLANEYEVTVRFFGGRSTIESSGEAIENARISLESGGSRRNLGIQEAATGRLVGSVNADLAAPGFQNGVVANISYNICPACRGQGYAPRAVRLMVYHLSEESAAEAAVIQFDPENHASARVARKAGFRPLGERLGSSDGKWLIVYGLHLRPGRSGLTLSDVCP
jgi:RimJ/RimL family protein N-acetyltransferase